MTDSTDFIAFDQDDGRGMRRRVLIRADHIHRVEELPQRDWNSPKQMRITTKSGGRYKVVGSAENFLCAPNDMQQYGPDAAKRYTLDGCTPHGTPPALGPS
jgi:hypothetical protein